MISGERIFYGQSERPAKRRILRIDQASFQMKYTAGLVFWIATFLLLAGVPMLYFTSQNYSTFYHLAYETSPELVEHLEREVRFLFIFYFFVFTAALAFFSILAVRLTARFASPVAIVEKRLRQLAKGQLYQPELKLRSSDEFPGLLRAYNYLNASLKSNAKYEKELLSKITVDPADTFGKNQVRTLIETKNNQVSA